MTTASACARWDCSRSQPGTDDSSSVSGNNGNVTVEACDDDSENLLKFVGRIDYCSSQGECGEACSDMLAMLEFEGTGGRTETRLEGFGYFFYSRSGEFQTLIWHHTYIYTLSDSQRCSVLGSQLVRLGVDQRVQCSCGVCQCSVYGTGTCSGVPNDVQEELILGFDMEWPVNFKAGSGKTALIQVCPKEDVCHLDFWKLSRDFGILVKPLMEKVIDLGKFANEVLNSNQNWSLDGLVLHLFRKRILKSENICISDWTKIPLSQEQENYAATDAYKILANRNIELLHQGTPHETEDILILVEHNPVYTVGIRAKEYSADYEKNLKQTGAEFYRTNRGGLVTFHGPGQLVAYPILNLKHFNPNVRWYVSQIEKTIIRTCGRLGLAAETSPLTGVWVGDKKICALGLQASRFITTHGLALNCDTDLTWFSHIVPCGIEGKGVTSLSIELKRNVTIEETLPLFLLSFSELFDCALCDYRKKDADIKYAAETGTESRKEEVMRIKSVRSMLAVMRRNKIKNEVIQKKSGGTGNTRDSRGSKTEML
uniref:lipoyl(octanoyl) transferase n=1 Tax=Timema monikensis TaxID=170555 RepID=A0A7R9HLD8_9NEOP|nr:unnamed protein product [Timema monikensis]